MGFYASLGRFGFGGNHFSASPKQPSESKWNKFKIIQMFFLVQSVCFHPPETSETGREKYRNIWGKTTKTGFTLSEKIVKGGLRLRPPLLLALGWLVKEQFALRWSGKSNTGEKVEDIHTCLRPQSEPGYVVHQKTVSLVTFLLLFSL